MNTNINYVPGSPRMLLLLFSFILLSVAAKTQGSRSNLHEQVKPVASAAIDSRIQCSEWINENGLILILLRTDSVVPGEAPALTEGLEVFGLKRMPPGYSVANSSNSKKSSTAIADYIKSRKLYPVIVMVYAKDSLLVNQFAGVYPGMIKASVMLDEGANTGTQSGFTDFLKEVSRLTDPNGCGTDY